MKNRVFKVLGANVLVFLVLLLLLEGTAQLIALAYPSYDVLFVQPDRVVGWKQVPGLRWVWAGHHWYASEFSVEVETNALGFRDLDREVRKSGGVKRVILLGDSLIEAVQVPFEQTAGQLLERRLNEHPSLDRESPPRWEVLNFGVSSYGIGQYLLAWEEYAKRYDADYVAIFVALFHMKRTVTKYEPGGFYGSKKEIFWIRPTFRLEGDELVREPARDFDKFVRAQKEQVWTGFAGKRSRKKSQLVLGSYASRAMRRIERRHRRASPPPRVPEYTRDELIAINVKVIEELGLDVVATGSRMVVLDMSRYFGDNEIIARSLLELCEQHGFGYIPVYEDLLQANEDGVSTRWASDPHFNPAGNEVLAESFFEWILGDVPPDANRP